MKQVSVDKDLLVKAYIRYAVNEVTDNTMTLGEFEKQINTNPNFKNKYLNENSTNQIASKNS